MATTMETVTNFARSFSRLPYLHILIFLGLIACIFKLASDAFKQLLDLALPVMIINGKYGLASDFPTAYNVLPLLAAVISCLATHSILSPMPTPQEFKHRVALFAKIVIAMAYLHLLDKATFKNAHLGLNVEVLANFKVLEEQMLAVMRGAADKEEATNLLDTVNQFKDAFDVFSLRLQARNVTLS